MTGLLETDTLLEVACLITLEDLKVLYSFAETIHQSNDVLQNMNEWCLTHHQKSGLTKRVQESKLTMKEVEKKLFDFISQVNGTRFLCGNTVYQDRFFLQRLMPSVCELLHYRNIDVSTIKELCFSWNKKVYDSAPKKQYTHTAQQDILESIEELTHYKQLFD